MAPTAPPATASTSPMELSSKVGAAAAISQAPKNEAAHATSGVSSQPTNRRMNFRNRTVTL